MSNFLAPDPLFAPPLLQEPPKVPPRKPKPTPKPALVAPYKPGHVPASAVKPVLVPPKGAAVPALQAQGFHGGIGDLADNLQRLADEHVATHGFVPKPGTLLALALTPPKPKPVVVKPAALELANPDKLLQGLVGNAKAGGYDSFMDRHGAQVEELLRNPATKAKTAAALSHARDIARLNRIQEAGNIDLGDAAGVAAAAASMPAKMSEYTTRATIGFVRDLGDLAEWGGSGGKKGSASFGHLEKTAPALAQVVKGLVYSPVGLAQTADAVLKDLDAANGKLVVGKDGKVTRTGGDFSFKHSREMAKSVGLTFVEDVTNPQDRAGYLFLDALGILSLGAGTAARAGAARAAFREADGIAPGLTAATRAARAPHPTRTATISKDGFDAQIRLAQNPLMRIAQQRWVDHAQAKLDRSPAPHTDLFGAPVDNLLPTEGLLNFPARVVEWASSKNPLAPERMIGRAENIRLRAEMQALAGLGTLLSDAAGSAARQTRWETLIPDAIFKGLTPGEMKGLELASYDIRDGLSAVTIAERNAQFAIENGIGDRTAWMEQLARTALARKALENPTPRFQRALEAAAKATAQMEAIKADAGWLTDRTMENRIVKAGALVEHFPEVAPMIEGHLQAKALVAKLEGIARKQPDDPALARQVEAARANLAANPYPFVDMDDGGIGLVVRKATGDKSTVAELAKRPRSSVEAEARLEALEAWRDKKLTAWAEGAFGPTHRAEVRLRTDRNKKAATGSRQGGMYRKASPTMKAEQLREVAARANAAAERNPDDPALKQWADRMAEIDELRAALNPDFGEARDAARLGTVDLTANLAEGESVVVPLNRNRPDSWYMPFVPKSKANKPVTLTMARTGPYGVSPAVLPSELRHEMTGAAYIHGDYRTDIHHLAGERLARTAKAFTQWAQWKKAWESASSEHKPGYIPIRDVRAVPDELRAALSKFEDEHMDIASADDLPDDLQRILFPDERELQAGEGFRWIDPRLLGHATSRFRGDHFKAFEIANDVLRPLIFYLYPKYAMNAVGNAGMLVMDQGFVRSYSNLVKAMRLEADSIGDDAALIKAAVGAGRSSAYALGTTNKINRALAEFWNSLTDEHFRVASFIHHAEVKGYKSPEDRHRLLTDPEAKADYVDVTRRANEALVAFDRMSPGERAWLRHLIFVYPWQRGAFLWSFRTVFEHPAKTALLATLGQDAYQDEEWLKHAAGWIRRTGFLPLNYDLNNEKLHVYNPTNVNTFATLADALAVVKAEVSGDQYASIGNLLGPPGQAVIHAALGVDEFGNRYTGSQLTAAVKGAAGTIPFLAVAARKRRKPDKPLPGGEITDRAALVKRYHGYLLQAATSPGALDGFGRLIWGADAALNLPAVAERWWRSEATPEQRHQRELRLVLDWTDAQGVYLDKPVPKAVRKAIVDQAQYTRSVRNWMTKEQRTDATLKERLLLRIDYFENAGRITAAQAGKLKATADGMEDPREIRSFDTQLAVRYGNAAAHASWDRDVRNAAGAVATFDYRMAQLHRMGLTSQRVYPTGGKTVDVGGFGALKVDKVKLDYARKYIGYLQERRALEAKITDGQATRTDLRLLDDSYDKPVGALPSLARFRMTEGTEADQHAHVARLASKPWGGLTTAEKAALGRDTDDTVSMGWAFHAVLTKAIRERDGGVDSDQKLEIVKLTNRKYPGFTQDWLYARKSRVERFERTSLYREMPEREAFDASILTPAKQIVAAVKAAEERGATSAKADARAVWNVYLTKKVQPWLKDSPELARALEPFGKRFLAGLISNG